MKTTYKFKAKVWVYPGFAGWRFVNLPKKISAEIKKVFGDLHRGWGSLPVNAEVGSARWKTSIFMDKKSASYLLPLKAGVRKKENIKDGAVVDMAIEIIP